MTATRPTIADKRLTFHQLHQEGCFAIPNPWDIGSALFLQSLGFKALASTSSGFAWSRGHPDGGVSLDEALGHLTDLVDATDIPLNADFEHGYTLDNRALAGNVRLAVETGVAGISIEDSTGDPARPLFDLALATERIRTARRAIDAMGGDTLLVGRAECFLVGRPDLAETITRVQAYANAGADCLYAPGLRTREQISTVVTAVAPRPVNVLVGWATDLSVRELAGLGVRRVSVGGALARSAWAGFVRAATMIAKDGTFDAFADAYSGQALDTFFAAAASPDTAD
jgi:2-methylisocitrate lyase-like PEP mutase family enzyme